MIVALPAGGFAAATFNGNTQKFRNGCDKEKVDLVNVRFSGYSMCGGGQLSLSVSLVRLFFFFLPELGCRALMDKTVGRLTRRDARIFGPAQWSGIFSICSLT